jgi:tripartite-type tricarboxylate transporter receptor subunit TctC
VASSPAGAEDYPSRTTTIVVPFTPGGTTDILGRLVAQQLEARWGKSFVVENKPGAGTLVGASFVAKAPPDGYTLFMATSTAMAINATLFKSLPYDPVTDLTPVALVAQLPFVLVVHPSLPVQSVTDLIAYAKQHPGQLSYATAGPGTPHHLFAEVFKSMTGIEMAHVPYRGTQPGLNDVVAGHMPLMFTDVAPAIGMLQGGKVRPLGVSTKARLIAAPAKTPPAILDKLHEEIKSIVATPEIRDRIVTDGMLPMDNPSRAALQAFVKSEIVRWGKIVQDAGIAGSQ